MRRALAALLALAGCAPAAPPAPAPVSPRRIVSLDYCADQYVLKLAPRDRILAVSRDAVRPTSYMRAAAAGLRRVAPRAEDVLVLKPDLVVRSYGGGPGAAEFFARAGIPVLQLPYAEDLPGIRAATVDVAAELGVPARGRALAAEMDARLAGLPRRDRSEAALYMTPGGVTAGPGTLVAELLAAAGLRNFQREPGWRDLPLERLAYERPDLVAFASFKDVGDAEPWSAARHPIARAQLDGPVVGLEGAWTACGGWFLLDAVEALARGPRP
ncbi:ABC transporter substrate-binding protein [Sphingomonas lenta]|uniref:Iron ABC transporter substrate-binding protein n=1 Tax=Sphingomonas lenta TaxID=1141887 RepID=A0A2A2SBU4_9SPHN|nr:ABC transporter substrate-binding protein [Sphingomonas lenta]PAX06726.1 iron ABC transporter substrate-binding protein [Sphingomonas lenta]